MIFNRTGERVFESVDPDFCWNGTYKGKLVGADVFVYVIRARKGKEDLDKKGNVTLIR